MQIEIPNSAQIAATIDALPTMFKHWLPILLMLMAISINPKILINKKQKEVKPAIATEEKTGKKSRLTLAELRAFNGFENISDEEGEAAITSLQHLSNILFDLYNKHKKIRKWNHI